MLADDVNKGGQEKVEGVSGENGERQVAKCCN